MDYRAQRPNWQSLQQMRLSNDMVSCIQECQNCASVCELTKGHCLEMGGEHARPAHLTMMADCVEICQTSANFMLRGSAQHALTCAVCAEICDRCAADCEQFKDDPMMQQCALACRACAQSCRQMASMHR